MSALPSATQHPAGSAWPCGIAFAGFAITGTLMWVTGLTSDYARAYWGATGGLETFAIFASPYALCAVGLWLGRHEQHLRWALRSLGLIVIVTALPSFCIGLSMVRAFWQDGVRYSILVHMMVAGIVLLLQYPLAILSVVVGLIARCFPASVESQGPAR